MSDVQNTWWNCKFVSVTCHVPFDLCVTHAHTVNSLVSIPCHENWPSPRFPRGRWVRGPPGWLLSRSWSLRWRRTWRHRCWACWCMQDHLGWPAKDFHPKKNVWEVKCGMCTAWSLPKGTRNPCSHAKWYTLQGAFRIWPGEKWRMKHNCSHRRYAWESRDLRGLFKDTRHRSAVCSATMHAFWKLDAGDAKYSPMMCQSAIKIANFRLTVILFPSRFFSSISLRPWESLLVRFLLVSVIYKTMSSVGPLYVKEHKVAKDPTWVSKHYTLLHCGASKAHDHHCMVSV